MTLLANGIVLAAWSAILIDNAILARRTAAIGWGRLLAAAAFVTALGGMGVLLDRESGGRLATSPPLVLLGTLLVVAGAGLHARARRVLGTRWSARIVPRAVDASLVDAGPYEVVRHPLYAALLLMALGSVLVHSSVATLCGAIGLAGGLVLKIRREERALAETFGARWDTYRARVPCVVPRLSSGKRE